MKNSDFDKMTDYQKGKYISKLELQVRKLSDLVEEAYQEASGDEYAYFNVSDAVVKRQEILS